MERQEVHEGDRTGERAEPHGMSWVVIGFMTMCLIMTAAMAYYAWGVFTDAV